MSEKDIKNYNNDKGNSKKKFKNIKKENYKIIGNYVLLYEIGKGTFSKVEKAFHIITEQEVAVKVLEKDEIEDKIDIERILREIEILKKVIHPNICQLYETYSTVHNFYIMMEHITGGDLFDYISDNNYLSENKSCRLFRQLISVIEYLNELGISHRDIKLENILLDDKHENLKLIDFGLSNYFSESKLLKSSCGSPCYASPEMLSGIPYLGITTDLWSSGIVLYSMLAGSLPFDDQELYELYKQIKLGKFYLPSTLSLEAIDLLKRILNIDPTKRISLDEIKNHKWFKMDEYPLYKGINLKKEKLGYNRKVIDYVMNNYFNNKNNLEPITQNKFIEMVENYCCNKYTATYYLTKKYILEIDDKDSIFKKNELVEKEEAKEKEKEKSEKNINLKFDKKMCKKIIKDIIIIKKDKIKTEIRNKIDIKNNFKNCIIKNDINLEIIRNKNNNKLEENHQTKEKDEKVDKFEDRIEKKRVLLTEFDDESNIKKFNKELFNKKLNSVKGKKHKNERKKNCKKNDIYLSNTKSINSNQNLRDYTEIKQIKFKKDILIKDEELKESIFSKKNNNYIKNNMIKTLSNNSINHISKNNKKTFINSYNNQINSSNYNNYFMYNLNAKHKSPNKANKKNYEINSFLSSSKGNSKVKKYFSSKKKDKKNKNYSFNNNSYNSKNSNTNYDKNKYSLTSYKEKENNYNFYLINNYFKQNEIKNNKKIQNINNNNYGKVQNIIKSDECDSSFNFGQYYLSKFRNFNKLKTIDLPGAYSLRNNTEVDKKKLFRSIIKNYNKIKVNLKEGNNKYKVNYSPKISNNKKNNIIIISNSLSKDYNNNISKSGRKKNDGIKKLKNIIINSDNNKNLLSNISIKKDNLNKNISTNLNSKSKKNKIDYKITNESKCNNNKLPPNQSESVINKNSKNYYAKSKYSKKSPTKNSGNSSKMKIKIDTKNIKQNILNNNNQNIINKNDINNQKQLINSFTTKNVYNKFKELFPIEKGNKTLDIKCHPKTIKNKILLMNKDYLKNKFNSPKEAKELFFFNDNRNNFANDILSNILNNRRDKKYDKMKQNFSSIYNRKKNLGVKTDNNISVEQNDCP